VVFTQPGQSPTLRRALITGASGGIGSACARALAEDGWDLILVSRRRTPLEDLAKELGAKVEVIPVALDLLDLEESEKVLKPLLKEYPCTGLLHSAGTAKDGLILRYPIRAFMELITLHLGSAFLLTQLTLPAMLEHRFGRIVFMGSTSALAGNAGQSAYSASKMGLVGLARSLTREVSRKGISINVIAPGWIETDMTEKILAQSRDSILSEIPARRIGTKEEVAELVRFLFSERSGYILGQTIAINGGLWMI
jgi:3-oxoacyl-[acyl-carrier protein] reductase